MLTTWGVMTLFLPYLWSLRYYAILWIHKELSLCEGLYNKLIDGVCFWVISVVPSAAVSRYGRNRIILSLHNVYPQHSDGSIDDLGPIFKTS